MPRALAGPSSVRKPRGYHLERPVDDLQVGEPGGLVEVGPLLDGVDLQTRADLTQERLEGFGGRGAAPAEPGGQHPPARPTDPGQLGCGPGSVHEHGHGLGDAPVEAAVGIGQGQHVGCTSRYSNTAAAAAHLYGSTDEQFTYGLDRLLDGWAWKPATTQHPGQPRVSVGWETAATRGGERVEMTKLALGNSVDVLGDRAVWHGPVTRGLGCGALVAPGR
jgi:hypothetical protein